MSDSNRSSAPRTQRAALTPHSQVTDGSWTRIRRSHKPLHSLFCHSHSISGTTWTSIRWLEATRSVLLTYGDIFEMEHCGLRSRLFCLQGRRSPEWTKTPKLQRSDSNLYDSPYVGTVFSLPILYYQDSWPFYFRIWTVLQIPYICFCHWN